MRHQINKAFLNARKIAKVLQTELHYFGFIGMLGNWACWEYSGGCNAV